MFWVTSSGCRPTPFTEITSSRYHKRATTSGIAGRFCRNSAINPTIIMWKVYIKIKELALHLKNSAQPYCQRPTCIWHLCQAKPWLKGASLDFPEALRICLRTPPPHFRSGSGHAASIVVVATFQNLRASRCWRVTKTSKDQKQVKPAQHLEGRCLEL